MTDKIDSLTKAQEDAIKRFMLARGGLWKRDLKSMWLVGTASEVLMGLRESHGEKWLQSYNGNIIIG